MKTIGLKDLVAGVILSFCENAAELGCRKAGNDNSVDMWYRYLSWNDQKKVANKLIEIMQRDVEMVKNHKKSKKRIKK